MNDGAAALLRGEVILIPTDTVWGLACRGDDPVAVERLSALKQRDPSKPFVRLVADWRPDDRDLASLPDRAVKAVRSLWPGALTIVAPTGRSVRMPAHPLLQEFLRAVEVPVLVTSANLSGEPEAFRFEDVSAPIREAVPVVIEGSVGGQSPSTVIGVGGDGWTLLREGPVSEEDWRQHWEILVAFVCTGNTCRSPMAEILARQATQAGGARIISAGMAAGSGHPASSQSIEVCRELGLDLSSHRSRSIAGLLADPPDFAYGMTMNHVFLMRDMGINAELLDPSGQDIPDPYGGPVELYRQTCQAIAAAVNARVTEWL